MINCTKTAFASRQSANHAGQGIAIMNGHPMRSYRCDRCGSWHLTSRGKVLPWIRVRLDLFRAAFGGGDFVVERRADDTWRVECPNGLRAGPFPRLGEAKQWCDAASFLPEDRWLEAARIA